MVHLKDFLRMEKRLFWQFLLIKKVLDIRAPIKMILNKVKEQFT
jgi:hypothetical protein